jgi:hypothetical protein
MNENEWLMSSDPERMLEFLRNRATERKLRLVAVGYVRRMYGTWSREHAAEAWEAVEVTERFVDGLAGSLELAAIHGRALDAAEGNSNVDLAIYFMALYAAAGSSSAVAEEFIAATNEDYRCRTAAKAEDASDVDRRERLALLREIFGNPFRRQASGTSHLAPGAVRLAQRIYDDRAFDRMPELAKLLEKAGMNNGEMLEHCRGPGPHVRGCWVVDELLGKQ